MASKCDQCEEHAELHRKQAGFLGSFLGIGAAANKPCGPCEDHARNGCPDIKWSWW
ncbi:hypothetical protein [Streptomyces formicae]